MKTILQSLAALCCCITAHAAQQVVPGGLANVEGNSSSSNLFINGVAWMVQVYSASEFSSVGAPLLRIDGVTFRLESGSPNRIGNFYTTLVIGTTSRSPDSLSPIFDENLGSDSITVKMGYWGFVSLDTTSSPRPFDLHIDFSSPFYYIPSRGNLALGIIAAPGISGPGTGRELILDAQNTPNDGIGRAFGGQNLSVGTVDTLGLVTRFDITPIPEPRTVTLSAIVLLVILAVKQRRAR